MQQPGGYYPRGANAPPGRYGNSNGNGGGGSGFRHGRVPPYRPPAPPPEQHQMTPKERERVLMAAGRLAAEYLVDRGDLPPDALESRPPAPIPFRQQHGPPAARFQGRPPPPQQQHHRQGFHFHDEFFSQGQQQRRFPGPRQFFHGPFPKRPRHYQGPPRSFPYGPRAPAPPHNKKTTGCAGQGVAAAAAAAPPAAETKIEEDERNTAVAGEAGDSQPTAQPGGASSAPRQPSSGSLGAKDSKSS